MDRDIIALWVEQRLTKGLGLLLTIVGMIIKTVIWATEYDIIIILFLLVTFLIVSENPQNQKIVDKLFGTSKEVSNSHDAWRELYGKYVEMKKKLTSASIVIEQMRKENGRDRHKRNSKSDGRTVKKRNDNYQKRDTSRPDKSDVSRAKSSRSHTTTGKVYRYSD